MRRALMIVNPIAGRGAGQRRLADVERGLRRRGLATEVAITSVAGDARGAAAQADDHDLVVAIGGDGTLNEVLNGLRADRPVALYPLGTGNVLAKELRLPRRVEPFCDMVERGRDRALDVGAVGGRRFISFAGVGFDAEVTAALAASRRGGIRMRSYVRPLLRCLVRYPFPRIEVCIDGRESVDAQGFALISNVRSYGGPFVIAPDAVPDDGVFDVCVLRRGSRLRYAWAMLVFALRCGRRLSGASYHRGRCVRVTADASVRYQVDGDDAGFLPATFEVLGRKARLIVP